MQPFRRLLVSYNVRFTTLVTWEFVPNFADAGPYTYQLQVSRTGGDTADDWVDVGAVAEDAAFLADDQHRLFGKTFTAHYRIQLTTGAASYVSPAAHHQSRVGFRDWRLAREIFRKERLRLQRYVGVEMALLKERRYGPRCTVCASPLTGGPRRSDCGSCFNTGYAGGYFAPVFDLWLDRNPEQGRESQDLQGQGTNRPLALMARVLGAPQLVARDVLVERHSGRRWKVDSLQHQAELRGVPIVVQAELRLFSLDDTIYSLPLEFP